MIIDSFNEICRDHKLLENVYLNHIHYVPFYLVNVLVGDYAFAASSCDGKSTLLGCLLRSGMKWNSCSGQDKGLALTCR